jgi:hypothetical protein
MLSSASAHIALSASPRKPNVVTVCTQLQPQWLRERAAHQLFLEHTDSSHDYTSPAPLAKERQRAAPSLLPFQLHCCQHANDTLLKPTS